MPNRLAAESSLYLRQHAANPVDWHPWNAEALALARRERKPILLSIGYSACHWCHVMAHESFEDADTAAVMNTLFVNIKVDREERPDLDRIYQLAHQALARRGGGWPLTVFLTPDDLMPFYAGTYFPPQARHGLPAFVDVVRGVRRWYDEQPQAIVEQNAALAEFLADHGRGDAPIATLDATLIPKARAAIARHFDPEHGGHRGAPKFPPPTEIELLLRLARDGDAEAGAMAELTLRRLAERGLQDHLGGGFFRYCVDAHWDIPHFEKMLYDNAALLACFVEAATRAVEPEFRDAAHGIVAWLEREMRLPGGGCASAMDADAEGEEGRFYLWSREEAAALLPDATREAFFATYGLADAPNFEHEAWHLQRRGPLAPGQDFAEERLALRLRRDARIWPARDDKCLVAWNAMLVRALVRGGLAWAQRNWIAHADAILAQLQRDARDGTRMRTLARASGATGFLDDHAFVLDALLERLQADWAPEQLAWAVALADTLLADFEDREHGGFFFTAHAHEALPQRPKPWFDDSTPSGNAVAVRALLRLGHLLGETRWLAAAERTLRAGLPLVADAPHGACALLAALDEFLLPAPLVVVRLDARERDRWGDALGSARASGASVYVLTPDDAALADKPHARGGIAYVCVGLRCLAPVGEPSSLAAALNQARE
jgi:uncharacterized protein YyaL (SSP411 family)